MLWDISDAFSKILAFSVALKILSIRVPIDLVIFSFVNFRKVLPNPDLLSCSPFELIIKKSCVRPTLFLYLMNSFSVLESAADTEIVLGPILLLDLN